MKPCVRGMGGTGKWNEGRGIAVDDEASAIVSGIFGGTATFGPGEPGETTLEADGSENVFVARFAP